MCEEIEQQLYNPELKIQYIEEKSQEVIISNNYLECQFNKSFKLENELDNIDDTEFAEEGGEF